MRRRAVVASERLALAMLARIESARMRLDALHRRTPFTRPLEGINRHRQELDDLQDRLRNASERQRERAAFRLSGLAGRLNALSPLAVLARGYTIVTREPEGTVVRAGADVAAGDRVRVQTRDGSFEARVTAPEREKTE
jgi:exodeoxyribonuclease VII large subunit